jgi:hypothetical protein
MRSDCTRTVSPLSGPRMFSGRLGFLEEMVCPSVLQPGEPEVHSCEGSSRDPPGDAACGDHRVARASRGLR